MHEHILKTARILIVDDQESNVRLLQRILESAGYTHFKALTDPRQVTALYQEWKPDLILMDLMMPHMDGFEVMKRLRPLVPRGAYLPILAITGDARPAACERALSEGAKDFLSKPIDRVEVLLRIANLLETRFLHLQIQDQNRALEETVCQRTREIRDQSTLIAKASDAILVRDLEGRIAFWNEGAERLYGWTSAEAVGRNINELLRGGLQHVEEARGTTMAQGEWSGELRQLTKNGTEVIVTSRWTLIRDEAGRPRSVLAINSDITKKKSLEAQLLHAQRMEGIGMVAGGVAHDFNNLLTVILGFSEMVMGRMMPTDPSRSLLEQVYKAGERAATLTRQLLAFSRKQTLQVRVLDLNRLIADAEKMLGRVIGEDIQVVTEADPTLGFVKADAGQIEQILLNLCVNSRDSMPRGGRITVTTRNVDLNADYAREHPYAKPGRYVLLAVRDTGAGMDEATRSRVFEPFFTTKEPGKGTGLGLAMVYGIVKQSGGSVEFDSAPGRGTTFQIYLPRVDEGLPARKSPSGEVMAPRGTETLLLVDDDTAVRSLGRLALETFGYTVLDAADGTAALLLSAAHPAPIHLLVTDVVMPGMNGRQLADRLMALRPGVKVLYVSGYTDDAVLRNGVAPGDMAFLAKPITPGMLARKVRLVLDECGLAPSWVLQRIREN